MTPCERGDTEHTMGDYPDFQRPDREEQTDVKDTDRPLPSKQGLQEIAHDRGRICKKRGCVVCAPLVEQRRLKKKQRRVDAQAALHAKSRPCGRGSCLLKLCVQARQAATSTPFAAVESTIDGQGTDTSQIDPDRVLRRQDERHRVGLPCGSEVCSSQVCIDGFAAARTRRHRARRPCRSATCDNAICVADRLTKES